MVRGVIKMVHCINLFIIIVTGFLIIGCSGDESFDEIDFYNIAPPSSGEPITPPPYLEGENGDYSSANWMNAPYFWAKNRSLASLTLPGTHNSGTSNYGPFWAPTSKCQAVNINKQLEWGVRFLDLRVGFDGKRDPQICHGSAGHANRTLDQVLFGIRNFLNRYPSECVVLCFTNEYNKEGQAIIDATQRLLYSNAYNHYVYDRPEVPYLNHVRGKMIYWRRYGEKGVGPGLKVEFSKEAKFELYQNAYLYIQDNYSCSGETKLVFVKRSLDNAMTHSGEISGILNLFISFTSYYNLIPAPWSDGPSMNNNVKRYIISKQRDKNNDPIDLGIIPSDYVDKDYVHKVLCTNFRTDY